MQRVLLALTAVMLFFLGGIAYAEAANGSGSLASESGNQIATSTTISQNPIPVRVANIARQPVYDIRRFTGTTRAASRAVMRSQISGRVDFLPLTLGQRVKKGQVLVELYNPEAAPAALSARVRWQQLQEQQEQQQRDFERISALYNQGQASRQDFEQARTALNSANDVALAAESEYQRASGLDQERQIRAPFAGVITSISTDVGEVVAPGQALLQLADPNTTELELVVSSQVANELRAGLEVVVNLPLQPDAQLMNPSVVNKAVVKEVSPFRDRGALPMVVLDFADANVATGVAMSADFKVLLGSEFVVPSSALMSYGYGVVVYRVVTNKEGGYQVEPVTVTLGAVQENGVLVKGKLEEGDLIVIAGTQRLFNGAAVQVMQ